MAKVKKLLNLQKRVICSSIHFFEVAWLALAFMFLKFLKMSALKDAERLLIFSQKEVGPLHSKSNICNFICKESYFGTS